MKINNLKLITVFVLTLLISATTLFAQDAASTKVLQKEKTYKAKPQQSTPQQRATKRTAKLTEQLGLSDEQATTIYKIHLKHISKMEAYYATQPDNRTQRVEDKNAIMEETKAEIAAQLTTEQTERLAEWEAKREEKRQSRRGRR